MTWTDPAVDDVAAWDPEVFAAGRVARKPLFPSVGRAGYPIREYSGQASSSLGDRLDAIRDEQDVEDAREFDGECS